MLKLLHSFLTAVIIGCFLAFPSAVLAENDNIPVAADISQPNETELIHQDIHVEDADIQPINTGKLKDSVIPDAHREGKKVIGLFIKTMVAVLFSAILLYFILFFVKKYRFGLFSNSEYEELDNLDLSTPNNKNDALKSFLKRTK